MEKQLKSARNLVNKIIKNFKRGDLDWTVQVSMNSTRPDSIKYCCQISAPANGLQPITWVCESWDELFEKLEMAVKKLDLDAVDRAWHESEIARCKALINYHEEQLNKKESES